MIMLNNWNDDENINNAVLSIYYVPGTKLIALPDTI